MNTIKIPKYLTDDELSQAIEMAVHLLTHSFERRPERELNVDLTDEFGVTIKIQMSLPQLNTQRERTGNEPYDSLQ